MVLSSADYSLHRPGAVACFAADVLPPGNWFLSTWKFESVENLSVAYLPMRTAILFGVDCRPPAYAQL